MMPYRGAKGRYLKYMGEYIQDIKQADTYIEPFGGGFSMGLQLFEKGFIQRAVYNEKNWDVYNVVHQHKNNINGLIFYEPIVLNLMQKRYREVREKQSYGVQGHSTEDMLQYIIQELGLIKQQDIYCIQALIQLAINRTNKGITSIGKVDMVKVYHLLDSKAESISETLQQVEVYNTDYTEIIKKYNDPSTFWFIDPPYDYTGNQNQQYYNMGGFCQEELSNHVKRLEGAGVLTNFPTDAILEYYKQYSNKIHTHNSFGGSTYQEIWVNIGDRQET